MQARLKAQQKAWLDAEQKVRRVQGAARNWRLKVEFKVQP